MRKDTITMSIKDLKRLHITKKANEKLITQAEAAHILAISERQLRRILQNIRDEGDIGVVHKSRGRTSNRKLEPKLINNIVTIYKTDFLGYKPTFFTEKLAEEHHISISKESVRQILIQHNLWTPKKKRKKHRTKRERKHHPGELIQLDGSVHQWFLSPEGYCVLMLYIDDATNTVFARFYTYEGTIPAFDSLRRYITKYGIPLALYADRHVTYKNNNKTLSIEEQLAGIVANTQFSRALSELSIQLIFAYSPQAKGRVERSFNTFQDRLAKELHRHKITTLKDANSFLEKHLKTHNKRFSIKPTNNTDLHRPALPCYTLNNFLCIKTTRSIANDFTIRHNNHLFQLKKSTIQKKAIVEDHVNGSIVIRINNISIPFKDITYMLQSKAKRKLPQTIHIDPISLKEIAS